ncbi:hypothetical protein PRIPAC_83164 [Pristionchus pacificus]|uniref:Uncharacterized protein n=1 Tax=Pristionchus pacificus TaxID=54126 RepID=A0A2A6BKL6_PRIPA|nr:hypothetical protein PRIPAC_83164 [Pristionchus pacificus]|eukprot:PDM66462.1 hypothetical protein PRIPAC_47879 [Pristionchus pacificus]
MWFWCGDRCDVQGESGYEQHQNHQKPSTCFPPLLQTVAKYQEGRKINKPRGKPAKINFPPAERTERQRDRGKMRELEKNAHHSTGFGMTDVTSYILKSLKGRTLASKMEGCTQKGAAERSGMTSGTIPFACVLLIENGLTKPADTIAREV